MKLVTLSMEINALMDIVKKPLEHLENNTTAYFTCGKEEGITTPKCPYCNIPTYLHCGNPIYSYWLCKVCNKVFVYDIYAEKIC